MMGDEILLNIFLQKAGGEILLTKKLEEKSS